MKLRVIADGHGIWLKSGPLRSTPSAYTTNYPLLCFLGIRRDLCENFDHVENVTTACDSFRCKESWPTASQRVSHDVMPTSASWGPSQVVVSSKSCSVRPDLDLSKNPATTCFLEEPFQNHVPSRGTKARPTFDYARSVATTSRSSGRSSKS